MWAAATAKIVFAQKNRTEWKKNVENAKRSKRTEKGVGNGSDIGV